jgi:phage-related protein
MAVTERPVVWVGSSRRDLREFPREVRRDIGRALYAAQDGEIDPAAKRDIELIRQGLAEAERLHRESRIDHESNEARPAHQNP